MLVSMVYDDSFDMVKELGRAYGNSGFLLRILLRLSSAIQSNEFEVSIHGQDLYV